MYGILQVFKIYLRSDTVKLICGLGNPGKEYENTRHNVGFMIIDNYCKNDKFNTKFNGLYTEKRIYNEKVLFLKPQSYMNLSGEVVKPFCDYFKIDYKDVLIIRDDLDLPLGNVRIKFDSSAGGDNGVKSIIAMLKSQKFFQYKIGISKNDKIDTKDYVLGKFTKEENIILNKVIKESPRIIEEFIKGNITHQENYTYGESL